MSAALRAHPIGFAGRRQAYYRVPRFWTQCEEEVMRVEKPRFARASEPPLSCMSESVRRAVDQAGIVAQRVAPHLATGDRIALEQLLDDLGAILGGRWDEEANQLGERLRGLEERVRRFAVER
jgi:hypothetical protein